MIILWRRPRVQPVFKYVDKFWLVIEINQSETQGVKLLWWSRGIGGEECSVALRFLMSPILNQKNPKVESPLNWWGNWACYTWKVLNVQGKLYKYVWHNLSAVDIHVQCQAIIRVEKWKSYVEFSLDGDVSFDNAISACLDCSLAKRCTLSQFLPLYTVSKLNSLTCRATLPTIDLTSITSTNSAIFKRLSSVNGLSLQEIDHKRILEFKSGDMPRHR